MYGTTSKTKRSIADATAMPSVLAGLRPFSVPLSPLLTPMLRRKPALSDVPLSNSSPFLHKSS
eukprot:scaffold81223_cov35-Tisochrysis_lutea.AAC.1